MRKPREWQLSGVHGMRSISRLIAALAACLLVSPVSAAEIKVLSAGAYKAIVLAIKPAFEKKTGHTLVVDNGTAGALVKRIEDGEVFDVVIAPPGSLKPLAASGKVVGPFGELARIGVGVMVPEGAPQPDISTVEAFKAAVLAAETVAYIDPASGGSSGVYLTILFEKLGIADAVKVKARLKQGGYVADLLTSGQAKFGIHQISEIVAAKGVTLVGPLPADIQNYTEYAGAVSSHSSESPAALSLLSALVAPEMTAVLASKGMEPPVLRFGSTKF
jgi:molybdate transport system substrate-binding protein